MSSNLPTLSPSVCYHLAEAAYRKDSKEYIQRQCPDSRQLDEAKIKGWRFILVERGEDLAVSFEGTQYFHLGHWKQNIRNRISFPKHHILEIQGCLGQWEKLYGKKITHHLGHSAGGFFARASRLSTSVFTVTFNGLNNEGGERIINLRTSNDFLTSRFIRTTRESLTVGGGGHRLRNFKKHLEGHLWSDIHALWSQSMHSDEKRALSQLSARL